MRTGSLVRLWTLAGTVTLAAGLVGGTASMTTRTLAAATDAHIRYSRPSATSETNARLHVDNVERVSARRIRFAPLGRTLPVITGMALEGHALTAGPGRWTGSKPLRYWYQWLRCSATAAECAEIAGARSQTYTPTASELGSRLRVRATAANSAGRRTANSMPTEVVVASAPRNTSLPTVSGTAAESQVLVATSGIWTGATPLTFTFQWQRCQAKGASCGDIAGATKPTYTPTANDVGTTVRVRVKAANATGSSAATSAATAVVAASPPTNTSLPAISGTAKQGQVLTAASGNWAGSTPMTFAYQWRRCDRTRADCNDIAGATGKIYMLTKGDVGATLRVRITAANSAGASAATSMPTTAVAPS